MLPLLSLLWCILAEQDLNSLRNGHPKDDMLDTNAAHESTAYRQ